MSAKTYGNDVLVNSNSNHRFDCLDTPNLVLPAKARKTFVSWCPHALWTPHKPYKLNPHVVVEPKPFAFKVS